VYQPLVYKPWRKLVELKREPRHRHTERQNADLERFTPELSPEFTERAEYEERV
jgi:hypothetical protein